MSETRAAHAVYFDGRTAAGENVYAILSGADLALRRLSGETLDPWPVAELKRTDPDAPAGTATFRLGRGAERLTILDSLLLEQLRGAGVMRDPSQLRGPRSWGLLLGGLAVAVGFGGLLIDQLPSLALPFVPRAVERSWSTAIENVLSADSRTCVSPAGQSALDGLLARLSTGAGIDHTPHLSVIDSPVVNAFTLPDGRIVLLRGLIDKAQDADELSGVVAHELGHVSRRDPTRAMLRALELNMLANAVGWGGDVAGQMAALSYGRRAEAAADASALRTLRAAGLRADGLTRFFKLLHAETGGDALPAFLSDHPATGDRARALDTGSEGETALPPRDWAAAKAMCDR